MSRNVVVALRLGLTAGSARAGKWRYDKYGLNWEMEENGIRHFYHAEVGERLLAITYPVIPYIRTKPEPKPGSHRTPPSNPDLGQCLPRSRLLPLALYALSSKPSTEPLQLIWHSFGDRPKMHCGVVVRDRGPKSLLPPWLFRPVVATFDGYGTCRLLEVGQTARGGSLRRCASGETSLRIEYSRAWGT